MGRGIFWSAAGGLAVSVLDLPSPALPCHARPCGLVGWLGFGRVDLGADCVVMGQRVRASSHNWHAHAVAGVQAWLCDYNEDSDILLYSHLRSWLFDDIGISRSK